MHFPRDSAVADVRVKYGRYVARRLRRAGFAVLSESVAGATATLKASARAAADADEATEDALADRDAADATLDTATQEARNRLAGRGVHSAREAPYTDLFPHGISYYTAATLDEQERRYKELKDRAEAHLPKADEARKALLPALVAGLKAWREGVTAVDDARTEAAKAATVVAKATDAWRRQVEKTYGALVQEIGRSAAEGYFPRPRTTAKASAPTPTPTA